jgi:putative ABC transport system permease protein
MKWSRFWQRQQRDADLVDELDAYIEHEIDAQIAAGTDPDAARTAALRKLGNVTRVREQVYERNTLVVLETLWKDVRFALRLFRRSPGFAAIAITSIAVGIGANASVFTLLDQVMLRSLPIERPSELVLVTAEGFQYGNGWGEGDELSYPRYVDLRDNNQVFAGMFCRFSFPLDVSSERSGERVAGELVSGTYFPVLGVTPALGRVFDARDEQAPGANPVVVLSDRFWRERFRSDPGVIGRSVRVNSHAMTIVGVAREGFDGTNLGAATDVFVPITMSQQLTPMETGLTDRQMRWLNVFGRLKPGISERQAQAGLQPLYSSRLQFEVQQKGFANASANDREQFLKGTVAVTPAAYGKSNLRARLTSPLWTLTAIGAGVLIIACANVANLLLARGSARRREIAVRLALGATRRRVVRQLLVESVLLALAGGAAGVLIATWGARGLLAFFTQPDVTLTVTPWPDGRILAFNVIISITTGVLFGLAPAWQTSYTDVTPALKTESGAVLGSGYARLRKGLVVAQVMLSLLLLVGAGLFLRSLHNLLAIDTGFDTNRLLSFSVDPVPHGYGPAESKMFAKTLLERVRATPGVAGAGFASHALLEGGSWNSAITIAGRSYDPNHVALTHNNLISPGYFDAMGIRVLAGRDFDARDERTIAPGAEAPQPSIAIVNEQFVNQYLQDQPALGLHIGFGANPGTETPIEIVGVVTTAKYTDMRSKPAPQLYFPYLEGASVVGMTMYVRTLQTPATLAPSMRQVVQQLDPTLPIYSVRTVEEQVNRSLVTERLIASLSSVLGTLATLLAMVGVYGVMSYTVARRTREIAIRMAFGARAPRIASAIVAEMLALIALGVLMALPALWWLNRYVASQLYGVNPTDGATIVSAIAILMCAAGLAVWVPSRRALRVSPMVALRDE